MRFIDELHNLLNEQELLLILKQYYSYPVLLLANYGTVMLCPIYKKRIFNEILFRNNLYDGTIIDKFINDYVSFYLTSDNATYINHVTNKIKNIGLSRIDVIIYNESLIYKEYGEERMFSFIEIDKYGVEHMLIENEFIKKSYYHGDGIIYETISDVFIFNLQTKTVTTFEKLCKILIKMSNKIILYDYYLLYVLDINFKLLHVHKHKCEK